MTLKITFRAGRQEFMKIKAAVSSAVMRGGLCEIRIEGVEPAEVAERTRALLEKLKTVA